MKTLRKILIILLWLLFAVAVFAMGYYFAVTAKTTLSHEKLMPINQNVYVYDAYGVVVDDATTHKQHVDIANIPKQTRMAFINVEDKRFYQHSGFDFRRIVKAAVNNLKSGSFKEGASTISQQLIKNTHLTHEKTINRKLKEWKLTRTLERHYTKDEILEKYLNVIYFGHNCFGLRSAARFYFDKTPEALDLSDSAILAGLVKSPNHYSPFKNAEKCANRKASVLKIMLKNGSITQEEMQSALDKPLPSAPTETQNKHGYMHFVFDELTALAEEHELTANGKLEIYTYLQPQLQNELETLLSSHEQSDALMSVVDTQTCAFKACVSSVGCIRRLPGSLLKPLLVYAPALELHTLAPATLILDEKIDYNGYSPSNYDDKYHGYVSTREAVAQSYNVPAVKILNSIGLQKAIPYLDALNLPVEKDDYSLALALGGMKNGYVFHDLLSAYTALANQGVYIPGGFISEIKIDGKSIYHRTYTPKRVFSKETSYLMTDMLQTAAQTGTAKKLRTLPFAIAAKTGTVGTSDGNSDAYAVSYTTRDCVGVWLGNASGKKIEYTGGGLPANYLFNINQALYQGYQKNNEQISPFVAPKNIQKLSLDKISYYDTHTIMLADDLAPPEYRIQEVFSKYNTPAEKSDFFSNPSIPTPTIYYKNNTVKIVFDKACSSIYQYKIERYDYVRHTTVYDGAWIETFTDSDVDKNKRYVYIVTPYYQDRFGKRISLPEVYTGDNPTQNDEEIMEKPWWEE